MVAAKPEGRCLLGYPRCSALELMGEDGTTGRDGGLHRLDEDVDGASVERGQPARLHEHRLPIGEIRIEQGQRRSIGHRLYSAGKQRSFNAHRMAGYSELATHAAASGPWNSPQSQVRRRLTAGARVCIP